MSHTSKLVLGVAIIAVILLGAFYWHTTQQTTALTPEHPEVTTLPSGSDTSDAAIDEDLQAVDAQLEEVHSDNADASASVNAAVSAE